MVRDIDDVHGLSADARRLYDWMIAAFTGDVNEALVDAQRHGTSISKWPDERLRKAHAELKERGVLASSAPELKPSRQHATRKKTSPAQLDREIAAHLRQYGLPNGRAKGRRPGEFDPVQLRRGIKVEMEHTRDPKIAERIAMDHLVEDPLYYVKLATIHVD